MKIKQDIQSNKSSHNPDQQIKEYEDGDEHKTNDCLQSGFYFRTKKWIQNFSNKGGIAIA